MYNLQGDKIDRRVCILDKLRPFLLTGFLSWVLQLVFNSLFEVLFYSPYVCWQVCLSQWLSSFLRSLLDRLLRLWGQLNLWPGLLQGLLALPSDCSVLVLCVVFPKLVSLFPLKII